MNIPNLSLKVHLFVTHAQGWCQFSSVQFSCSVMSDSLRPHKSQHARPPCLSPTPGVHSDSRPSSQWCHPAVSSSVIPFSSCPQSLPASQSFPMSQLFSWGGQSTNLILIVIFPSSSYSTNKTNQDFLLATFLFLDILDTMLSWFPPT